MDRKEINWLDATVNEWRARASAGRVPHAVALLGRPGIGKRALAEWIATEQLGLAGRDSGPRWPRSTPSHADLHWVVPEPERHSIGIEQLRDLIADLALTSYEGRGKVAVLEPANAMTDSAANSLLKTLEEPAGDALILLIVDRVGRLPTTVFSRCQKVRVPVPDEAAATAWLSGFDATAAWQDILAVAGGAPIAALEGVEWAAEAGALAKDFAGVGGGRVSPVDVAARWSKLDTGRVLDWLAQAIQASARFKVLGDTSEQRVVPESVLRSMDTRNLFCYLDIINRLRAQAPGSFKPELAYESLLIDWASRLESLGDTFVSGELLPGR